MTKYHAIPTEVDGVRFASRMEARRYRELRLLEQAGAIEKLTLQRRHTIRVNGVLICAYVSDFEYRDVVTGRWIVEDVKGKATPVYKLKAKLMRAVHGIEVQEVQA
jgi:hypothetical protein